MASGRGCHYPGCFVLCVQERPEARVISECPMLGKPKTKLTLLDVLLLLQIFLKSGLSVWGEGTYYKHKKGFDGKTY